MFPQLRHDARRLDTKFGLAPLPDKSVGWARPDSVKRARFTPNGVRSPQGHQSSACEQFERPVSSLWRSGSRDLRTLIGRAQRPPVAPTARPVADPPPPPVRKKVVLRAPVGGAEGVGSPAGLF